MCIQIIINYTIIVQLLGTTLAQLDIFIALCKIEIITNFFQLCRILKLFKSI